MTEMKEQGWAEREMQDDINQFLQNAGKSQKHKVLAVKVPHASSDGISLQGFECQAPVMFSCVEPTC